MNEKTKALIEAITTAVQAYAGEETKESKPEQKTLPLEDKAKKEAKPDETKPETGEGKETVKDEGSKTGNITITADALTEALSNAIKQNAPDVGAPSSGGSVLTLDAVKQMSEAEINANWKQVSKVLADSKSAQQ